VTGHSHFQTSSTSFAKVGKIAKGRVVASVVFQELLQELVLPHCESVDELVRIFSNVLVMFVTVSGKKPLPYQGSENHHLKRASWLFVDNSTVTTNTLEQFTQSFTPKQ